MPIEATTTEELELIRDYILMPHIMTMLDDERQSIERAGGILMRAKLSVHGAILDRVLKENRAIRQELKQRGIEVYNEEYDGEFIYYYKYVVRGYDDTFPITREAMKAAIQLRLTRYVAETSQALREL